MDEEENEPKGKGVFNRFDPADIIVMALVIVLGLAVLGVLFIPEKREAIQEGRGKEFIGVLGGILALITAHVSRRGGRND